MTACRDKSFSDDLFDTAFRPVDYYYQNTTPKQINWNSPKSKRFRDMLTAVNLMSSMLWSDMLYTNYLVI